MKKRNSIRVFEGIEIEYLSVKRQEKYIHKNENSNGFSVIHCKSGRLEWINDNRYSYMLPGDLAIVQEKERNMIYDVPSCLFKGTLIRVDMEKAPKCLSCFLDDVNVVPENIWKRLDLKRGDFIMESQSSIEHIFDELYNVPDEIRMGYLKVKVLELLLFLSVVDVDLRRASYDGYSPSQELLAKQARAFMASLHHRKLTVEQVAENFHVSKSHLKNTFKEVFGETVFSIARRDKMRMAANEIMNTDRKIVDIALSFGYENSSKFSKAFHEVMGENPKEYRQNMLRSENL